MALAIDASQQFPKEDAVRILLARTYLSSGKYEDCYKVLANASILPYEGQSDVHQLYVQSLVTQALANMKKGQYQEAIKQIETSRDYPERLGTGKPGDPDYRIQDYLESLCYEKLNATSKAEEARERIKAWASRHGGGNTDEQSQRVEEWYRTSFPAQPELEALQALTGAIYGGPRRRRAH